MKHNDRTRAPLAKPSNGKRSSGAAPSSAAATVEYFVSGVPFQPSPPLEPGYPLLDRFTIKHPLGTGRFARVYLAHDAVRSQDVALKVVELGSGCDESAIEQLRSEVALHSRISDHRHVIQMFDVHPAKRDGTELLLLSMEHAEGGTFRGWLNQNRDVEQRRGTGLALVREVCQGVKALHDVGIVHRDLKPENVLLAAGKAKVTDFGLGRLRGSDCESNPELLRCGVGTPQYMSPEQFHAARQKNVGPASDIYSLGVVLYELLDGSTPFDGTPIELSEKHLHTPPPRLKGPAERWWGIVEKCLAKDPEARYPSVDELIKDLDRAIQGTALSVDVACPRCGHINDNVNLKTCEDCPTDLACRFRPCPVCAKSVRLDVEACPGCGAEVAAYYLLLERKEQVEKLKDEEPAEAIELLETILRSGAGDYRDRAVQLIRELRGTQLQAGTLIRHAEEEAADGLPDRAMEAWREVLKLFPRHRLALQAVQELTALRAKVREMEEKANQLMDHAEFPEADRLLQECLRLIPAREQAKGQLESCRQRAGKYAPAFDQAMAAHQSLRLREAMIATAAALQEAQSSAEALALRSQSEAATQRVDQLYKELRRQLRRAEFAGAKESIRASETLQLDHDGVKAACAALPRLRKSYTAAMNESRRAQRNRDLAVAASALARALKVCPDAENASTLLAAVKAKQEQCRQLLAQAATAIVAASFDQADAILLEIDAVWPTRPGLAGVKEDLASTQTKYTEDIGAARQALVARDLDSALRAAQSAAAVCPSSGEAAEMVEGIQNDQAAARLHLQQAYTACYAAEFQMSRVEIGQVKTLWQGLPEVGSLEADIAARRTEYEQTMSQSRTALKRRKFDVARAACGRARALCPGSTEAAQFAKTIKNAAYAEQSRRAAARAKLALFASSPMFAVIAGVALASLVIGPIVHWQWMQQIFWPCLVLYYREMIAVAAVMLAATMVIHLARCTNLYQWIFSEVLDGDSEKTPFAVAIVGTIVLLICGLPALGIAWLGVHTFGMSINGGVALGLLTGMAIDVVAIVHAALC